MLFRQNNFCMGAALGSQYGAMTVAAELRYENKLLKAKEPAPDV
jgi:hypothetical protein